MKDCRRKEDVGEARMKRRTLEEAVKTEEARIEQGSSEKSKSG